MIGRSLVCIACPSLMTLPPLQPPNPALTPPASWPPRAWQVLFLTRPTFRSLLQTKRITPCWLCPQMGEQIVFLLYSTCILYYILLLHVHILRKVIILCFFFQLLYYCILILFIFILMILVGRESYCLVMYSILHGYCTPSCCTAIFLFVLYYFFHFYYHQILFQCIKQFHEFSSQDLRDQPTT